MSEWKRIARIGRPPLGGEFLDLATSGGNFPKFKLRRFRKMNHSREEPRAMDVWDLPAEAMIYDLLEAIESIVATECHIDWDDHGLAGDRLSLRQRLTKLSQIGEPTEATPLQKAAKSLVDAVARNHEKALEAGNAAPMAVAPSSRLMQALESALKDEIS